MNISKACNIVRSILDDPTGKCYMASEALYHLLGGKEAGLTPMVIRHHGLTHWYLRDRDGNYIDLTADQFDDSVDYKSGRGCGFLTKQPSKRTKELMGWQ